MSKPKVLIVDGDEWIAKMLADGLRDRSFDVRVTLTGNQGMHALELVAFDCVVIDPRVPGLGGFALVRGLRRMKSPIAKVPVIFLSSVDNDDGRATAFQAGGDVYLTKPFRLQDVAIQVKALVRLSRRMTSKAALPSTSLDSLPALSPPRGQNAIEADLEQMSLASVLTLLEMERRSGEVTVRTNQGLCMLDVAAGTIIGARLNGDSIDPLGAIAELLRWKSGRFQFKPGELGAPVGSFRPIGQLLLEATRMYDEAMAGVQPAQDRESAVPSSRTSWPPPSTWAKRRHQVVRPRGVSSEPLPAAGAPPAEKKGGSGVVRRPEMSESPKFGVKERKG